MITDPTPSARSCQRGIFPAPRCTGTTTNGEANICSLAASCHGNQPDGKNLARPQRDQSLMQGSWQEFPGEGTAVTWGWEGKTGFICILILES